MVKAHPKDISAFNCHARATLVGDAAEAYAIRSLINAGKKAPTYEEFTKLTPEDIVECYSEELPELEN